MFSLSPMSAPDLSGVISLALAKAQLGIDATDTSDDVLINQIRDAAVELVASFTMRPLAVTNFRWSGDVPLGRAALSLGVGPVTSVASISWRTTANVVVNVVVNASTSMVIVGANGRLSLAPGESWPSDVADIETPMTIEFSAGYAAGAAPKPLVQAGLLMLGHLFRNREAVVLGGGATELPLAFTRLCDPYRVPVVG